MSSTFSILTETCRAGISTSLLLSAFWKTRHVEEFRLAYRTFVPRRYYGIDRSALYVLATAEVVFGLLLWMPRLIGRLAAFGAGGLLVSFLVIVAMQRDLSKGCGCWGSSQPVTRGVYVVRNSLLALGGVLAAMPLRTQPTSIAATSALLGICCALLIMSIPQIAGVLHPMQSAEQGASK